LLKADGKDEGKKKKRSRSKEKRRQSRKKKRDRYRSRERSRHSSVRKRSSSSSASNQEESNGKKKTLDLEITSIVAPQPDIVKNVEDDVIENAKSSIEMEQNLKTPEEEVAVEIIEESISRKSTPQDRYSFERNRHQESNRKERLPEIAPFRIESRNNLLLKEKITRPFSSPFKKALDTVKQSDSTPKVIEIEAVVENSSASVEEIKLNSPSEDLTEEKNLNDWDEVDTAPEIVPCSDGNKQPESKRCWSSSASSSSRSSR
jgi:hypothetical protein